jgi:hypothetical protein
VVGGNLRQAVHKGGGEVKSYKGFQRYKGGAKSGRGKRNLLFGNDCHAIRSKVVRFAHSLPTKRQ